MKSATSNHAKNVASREFQGCIFDIVYERVIERGPVLRGSYAEAIADAKALLAYVNGLPADKGVGLFEATDCYVLVDGVLAYSEEEATA